MIRPHFISWQPVLTDHQAHTLVALAEAANATIATVAVAETVLERRGQGWLPVSLASLTPTMLPSLRRSFSAIWRLLRARPDTIHLFCSPFGDVRITLAMLAALAMGRRVYLVSEPYSPVGVGTLRDQRRAVAALKARLRPALYHVYGALIRRQVAGVFAISGLAVRQYRAIGIVDHRIHAFGYFVPPAVTPPAITSPAETPPQPRRLPGIRLCFVGSLIARKGATQFAMAARAAAADGAVLSLDIYGPGDASSLGANDAVVHYCGPLAFGTAGTVIAGYDALVVPSEHDGWGVVVNEAVMAGVPVIARSSVGAAAMIARWGCGLVYDGAVPERLRAVLRALADDTAALLAMRSATAALVPLLDPRVAGDYMWAAMNGAATPCLWYDKP